MELLCVSCSADDGTETCYGKLQVYKYKILHGGRRLGEEREGG